MKSPRYWTVVLLFVVTAVLLYHRGDADHVPYAEPLSGMPQIIDGRTSYDVPMEAEVLAVLGKGDFLNRVYVPSTAGVMPVSTAGLQSSSTAPIGLFIGYFATQRTGQTIHSPQHCLPGAGWAFLSSDYTYITAANGKKFHVGEYVISDGTIKQYVLYWYQAHGRSVANEYAAKFYMIADAIRTNRTDGALVRVISPIRPDESVDAARQRVVRFTDQMAPSLNRFIPD
jgi:EpsI family protein